MRCNFVCEPKGFISITFHDPLCPSVGCSLGRLVCQNFLKGWEVKLLHATTGALVKIRITFRWADTEGRKLTVKYKDPYPYLKKFKIHFAVNDNC